MLLNVSIDTLELKGKLLEFDQRELSKTWITGSRSRYYHKSFISTASNNIFLYIGLTNNQDRNLDFKIKFGSIALNTIDISEILETLLIDGYLKVSLVDIAFDYDTIKMSENLFTIFKKSKQIINNRSEIITNLERGYKFFKGDIVTGFVWGDRSRLYIRAYDKIEEIKENKNYVKEKFIKVYNSDNVYRIEFSIRGKFKDYDLNINKHNWINLNRPSFYVPHIKEYIDKKVQANYFGKKVLNDLAKIKKIKGIELTKSLRVSIDDTIQLNQGLGNIKSYLNKKYPEDKKVIETFMNNFYTFLNNQDKYYDDMTE